MISKYVNVGDRIDIESIKREGDVATEKKVSKSQVFDIE